MIAVALDAILVLVVLEAIGLTLLRRRTGRGPRPAALAANLLAGFLLMLAVRVALGDTDVPPWRQAGIAAILAGALVAHLLDLAVRWHD